MNNAESTARQHFKRDARVRGAAHVTTFLVHRVAVDGHDQSVEVSIRDYGHDGVRTRWSVFARADDGKTAAGNPGDDLGVVLATVHWQDLG